MAETVINRAAGKQSQSINSNLSRLKESKKIETVKRPKFKNLKSIIPKPEVWARVRPPPSFEDNILKVDETGKQIGVKLDDPYRVKEVYEYPTDGVLYNTSQDETFKLVANDLVEKALGGTSVLFLVLGSAQSGKRFTLFGTPGKYDVQCSVHRGLIPRTVDKICNRMEVVNNDKLYQLFISGVQISQNHIKDLVTMTPYNIDCIGDNGPCQTLLHEVYNRNEAGAILHRIFSESKTEKTDAFSKKFHMFIYLDICVINVNKQAPVQRSRITFAKVASIPKREHLHKNFGSVQGPCIDLQQCSCEPIYPPLTIRSLSKFQAKDVTFPYESIKCCRRKLNNSESDNSTDATDIRRDLFFLEQLFVRANVLRKLSALKLKRPDLVSKYMAKLQVTPSQFIRGCKLTHCLKDMCKVKTEIRVLIHVRPETANIDITIDTLKFAERAKGIKSEVDTKYRKRNKSRPRSKKQTEDVVSAQDSKPDGKKLTVEESMLSNILSEAGRSGNDVTVGLNPYQIRMINQQLNEYFTEKLELEEVKEKPYKKMTQKSRINYNIVGSSHLHRVSKKASPKHQHHVKHVNRRRSLPSPITTAKAEINKIPTPPPSAVESTIFPSVEQNDGEKKSEDVGGETITVLEKEKSADVIFKKEDDKHANKKAKKDALKSKGEKPKKEVKVKTNSLNSTSDKKVPSSAKSRKKSRAHLNTPPNTAPLGAKEKKKKLKEAAIEQEQETIEDSPPTCLEVWNAFLQTHNGYQSYMELKRITDSISKFATELSNLNKYSKELLEKITPLQAKIDDIKAQRFIKFKKRPELMRNIGIEETEKKLRYDIKIMQLSRDPLLVRLRNMNQQKNSGQEDTNLEDARKSCESEFQFFSLHHYGMLFPVQDIPICNPGYQFDSKTASPGKEVTSLVDDQQKSMKKHRGKNGTRSMLSMRNRTKSFPEDLFDSVHSKHYANVSRIGKVQAAFLRKLNSFRPAWIKYY